MEPCVSVADLQSKAKEIRNLILDMCVRAGTGHVTSAFSCTEIMVSLFYSGLLRFDPSNPSWRGRDRFILSKGQASVILYPILADLGFFPKSDLDTFCQADGKFGVHLQHDVPGAEITSGSLGQGFGLATGLALAAKMNRELHLVFCLLGDGECYEGAIWEAAMFAGHNRLNNLVAIVDRNYLCVTNFTESSLALEPMEDKWRSFGWRVARIDGHDINQILKSLEGARSRRSSQPLVVIADTVKGEGVSFICNEPIWHGLSPKGDEAVRAKEELE